MPPCVAAAGGDVAVHLGLLIRPDDDFAAVAGLLGIGHDPRHRTHVGERGILNRRIGAVSIAADQHRAAAGLAAGIDHSISSESHAVTEHLNLAAAARAGCRRHAACAEQSGRRWT